MLGISLDLTNAVRRVLSVPTPDFYVDSVNGSDSNDGLTQETAKQTLTAADALLTTGSHLALVSGSSWRETLAPGEPALTIASTAGLPVIDGSDVVTGWTAHATEANVWEKTWAHNNPNANLRLCVFEDGVNLTRVANLAACGASPGSLVDVTTDGSGDFTVTLQIHATGSGNPNTNGKVYEAGKREHAMVFGSDATISQFHARRAINPNGSLIAGPGSTVSQVLASDGTRHNFFLYSGTATDCIALNNDPPTSYDPGNTMFVSYMDDPTADSYVWERCGAVKKPGTGAGGQFGIAHGVGELKYISGTARQCWAIGRMFGGHPGGATAIVETGCHWECLTLTQESAYTLNYSTARIPALIDGGGTGASHLMHTFAHCAFYFEDRLSLGNTVEAFRMPASNADKAFTNTVIAGARGNTNMMANSFSTGGTLTANLSVFYGFGNQLWLDPDTPYIGNYNIFFSGNAADFQGHDGTTYRTTLAAWQAATGQDADSVRCATADQVAGGANALWMAYAQAVGGTDLATIGPAVGDFRINPNARVYGGDGTAYIGTFPDGTLITTAGPQNHWDWNTRGVASGPPTAFPTVPTTLEDSEAYCTDPAGWDFYTT